MVPKGEAGTAGDSCGREKSGTLFSPPSLVSRMLLNGAIPGTEVCGQVVLGVENRCSTLACLEPIMDLQEYMLIGAEDEWSKAIKEQNSQL